MNGENQLSILWAQMHLLLKTLNMSPLGRGRGWGILSPVCEVIAVLNWFTTWSQTHALYIKAQPHHFFLRRANFHHKDTRTVNIDLLDRQCTSRHRPLKHLLMTTQPSRLWGNNAKWPPVLSAAHCKYLKEINFSEWKAPFFVLQPPLLPSHVDFGAVHTASTCTFQLFACQDHCGFLAWF